GALAHNVLPLATAALHPSGSSNTLRQADRHPASVTDPRGQQGKAKSPRCASLARAIAMLQLLRPEFGDVRGKFGIVLAELVELATVMPVDLGLDRIGAGERGFLGHERGGRAEREAGD